MRQITLVQPLPSDVHTAWSVFVDIDRWPEWRGMVLSASGAFEPGARWTIRLRGDASGAARTMRPTFVSRTPGREIVFETRLVAAWVVRMVHRFELEAAADGTAVLVQRFEVSGLAVPLLWGPLERGMRQFEALGGDLARRLTDPAALGRSPTAADRAR